MTKDVLSRLVVPADASAFVCGPPGFMADIQEALIAVGVDASRIHTELFGALSSINPGLAGETRPAPHQPAGPPGTGPLVTFARSSLSTRFRTDTAHVLELAEACDVSTRWSCRSGVCHTCSTPLLSGSVSHDPSPVESPVRGEILICCARPDTDVILDM